MNGEHDHDERYITAAQLEQLKDGMLILADRITTIENEGGGRGTPEPTPTPPPDPPAPSTTFAFQPDGWTWWKCAEFTRPTHPTGLFTPPNNYIDGDAAYPNGVEIVGPRVERPRYDAARRSARYLRGLADNGGTFGDIPDNVKVLAHLDPTRCVPLNATGSATKISLTGGTMPGVFAAATDIGWTMQNSREWADHLSVVLANRDWWKDHNFRSHAIVLLAAAASNTSRPQAYLAAVKGAVDDMAQSTLTGLVNAREVDRERSIHYQLYEMHGLGWATLWLRKYGVELEPATLAELRPYCAWLREHVSQAVAKNNARRIDPTTPTTWYRFSVGDKAHTEIGPVDENHWGPSCELMHRNGWVDRDAPPKMRGLQSTYHLMAKVPS